MSFHKNYKTKLTLVSFIVDKEKLLKYSIFISLIGLMILFLINQFIEIEKTPISQIDESYLGKTVKIEGAITNIQNRGNISLLSIDRSVIDIVVFSKIHIEKGTNVSIIGKVEEYDGELQIRVDRVSLS